MMTIIQAVSIAQLDPFLLIKSIKLKLKNNRNHLKNRLIFKKKIRIVSVNDKTRIECVIHRKRDERTKEDVFIALGSLDD